jgi:hypothetical protein
MKIWNLKFKRLLSNKGEFLAETMMSFLVLAILMAVVFLVIGRAMTMAGDSTRKARTIQENEVNPAILLEYGHSEAAVIQIFTTIGMAQHNILFNTVHAAGDPACGVCVLFPDCPDRPCPVCCNCNTRIAFSPLIP